jgi:hypothetical protein
MYSFFLDDRSYEDSAPLPDILKGKENLIIENGILFDIFIYFCSVLSL